MVLLQGTKCLKPSRRLRPREEVALQFQGSPPSLSPIWQEYWAVNNILCFGEKKIAFAQFIASFVPSHNACFRFMHILDFFPHPLPQWRGWHCWSWSYSYQFCKGSCGIFLQEYRTMHHPDIWMVPDAYFEKAFLLLFRIGLICRVQL